MKPWEILDRILGMEIQITQLHRDVAILYSELCDHPSMTVGKYYRTMLGGRIILVEILPNTKEDGITARITELKELP